MAKIKLIIFDFDGTLADTRKMWESANSVVFKNEGIKNYKKLIRKIIHNGRKIKDVLVGIGINEKRAEEITEKIHKIVLKKKIKLVFDIKSIEKIQIRKVVVSNSITKVLKKALQKIRFDGIYGGDLFKTKEQFFKKLFKKWGIKSKEAVYVGDRQGDVAVARKAGCLSVIISGKYAWNTHKEIMKAKPDFILGSLGEIGEVIS